MSNGLRQPVNEHHDASAATAPSMAAPATTRRVTVVIVNYKTWPLVIDCLRSLDSEVRSLPGARVIVTDNDSRDGSVQKLSAAIDAGGYGDWATLMPLDRNGGFSYGNNAAIRQALADDEPPDYVYLLNPDTVARPNAIGGLASFLDAHERVGIAGGGMVWPDGSAQEAAHRFPSPLGELNLGARFGPLNRLLERWDTTYPVSDTAHGCDWVSGATMMVRREVFERIGLLDERYFLYFDEVDFCRRAREAGFEVWYVPASCVMHLEGAVTGIQKRRVRRMRHWYDSRRRFFVKYYGVTGLVIADLLWGLGRLSLVARHLLRLGGNMEHDPTHFAWDLLSGDLRSVLSGQAWTIRRERGT